MNIKNVLFSLIAGAMLIIPNMAISNEMGSIPWMPSGGDGLAWNKSATRFFNGTSIKFVSTLKKVPRSYSTGITAEFENERGWLTTNMHYQGRFNTRHMATDYAYTIKADNVPNKLVDSVANFMIKEFNEEYNMHVS